MTQNIRTGLVGLGRFGALHGRILNQLGNVDIVAVCDPRPDALDWATAALGNPLTTSSFDQLLAVPDLDALFIITPEDVHAEQALQAIERGIPTFMEKPLATSVADAELVVAASRARDVYLQIGFVVRFDAQHAMLRSRIAAGELGDIVTFRAKRNCSASWFPIYGDRAHSVYETIIHDIDLILWFTQSRVERIYAVQRHLSGLRYPDALVATLQLANGTMATLETSWLVPDSAPRNVDAENWKGTIDAEFEIVGTRETARYRLLDSGVSIASASGMVSPEVALWPDVYGAIGGALRLEDEHFIDCVRSGQPSPIASLEDALHGLQIAEAIVRSAEEEREIRL